MEQWYNSKVEINELFSCKVQKRLYELTTSFTEVNGDTDAFDAIFVDKVEEIIADAFLSTTIRPFDLCGIFQGIRGHYYKTLMGNDDDSEYSNVDKINNPALLKHVIEFGAYTQIRKVYTQLFHRNLPIPSLLKSKMRRILNSN